MPLYLYAYFTVSRCLSSSFSVPPYLNPRKNLSIRDFCSHSNDGRKITIFPEYDFWGFASTFSEAVVPPEKSLFSAILFELDFIYYIMDPHHKHYTLSETSFKEFKEKISSIETTKQTPFRPFKRYSSIYSPEYNKFLEFTLLYEEDLILVDAIARVWSNNFSPFLSENVHSFQQNKNIDTFVD